MPSVLVFRIRPSSLYSIRATGTFQSALSYPLPPPSTIKGMLANALQRAKPEFKPIEAANLVENKLVACAARLDSVAIASRNLLRQVIWDEKQKELRTDALGRESLHSHDLTCLAVIKDKETVNVLADSLRVSPICLGDNESLVSTTKIDVVEDAEHMEKIRGDDIEFNVYAPAFLFDFINGEATFMWLSEKLTERKDLPLILYILPLKIEGPKYIPLEMVRAKVKIETTLIKTKDHFIPVRKITDKV